MPDPEMVSRAHRAAVTLERAWERWRIMHGLTGAPVSPVSSYVGYSIEEPWGRPRVVFGIDAAEAEMLAALLDSHQCVGPFYRPEPASGRSRVELAESAGPREDGHDGPASEPSGRDPSSGFAESRPPAGPPLAGLPPAEPRPADQPLAQPCEEVSPAGSAKYAAPEAGPALAQPGEELPPAGPAPSAMPQADTPRAEPTGLPGAEPTQGQFAPADPIPQARVPAQAGVADREQMGVSPTEPAAAEQPIRADGMAQHSGGGTPGSPGRREVPGRPADSWPLAAPASGESPAPPIPPAGFVPTVPASREPGQAGPSSALLRDDRGAAGELAPEGIVPGDPGKAAMGGPEQYAVRADAVGAEDAQVPDPGTASGTAIVADPGDGPAGADAVAPGADGVAEDAASANAALADPKRADPAAGLVPDPPGEVPDGPAPSRRYPSAAAERALRPRAERRRGSAHALPGTHPYQLPGEVPDSAAKQDGRHRARVPSRARRDAAAGPAGGPAPLDTGWEGG
jgi:hypothetical protein